MSTVVLARKYRPKSFDQMVGQEHVVRALSNALQQQRLHHAYLFTGTRGIGKTTVSRILAKSLNCTGADGQGGITAHPCGVCQACTEIDADRYLDYIELDAASNRSIDEIRDLIERAAYKPGIGRFKVFMIDEAHQLTKDAFNALLKTLEEPPDYLKFVLATTDPDKMLPTVLSRCLQFNLRPMAPETVRAHLQHVLDAESVGHDDGALRLLATAARGSMRDALSLADQAIAYGAGRLDADIVRAMLGSVDRGHATAIVEALARRDGRAVLAAVDGLRRLGLSASGLLDEIAALLQQMAVEQSVPGALDADDPDAADAQRLAALLPADETQLLYSIVLQGRAELALMSDEYGALTMVLLRLLAFPPLVPAGGASRPAPRAMPLQAAAKEAKAAIAVPVAARAAAQPAAARLPAAQPPVLREPAVASPAPYGPLAPEVQPHPEAAADARAAPDARPLPGAAVVPPRTASAGVAVPDGAPSAATAAAGQTLPAAAAAPAKPPIAAAVPAAAPVTAVAPDAQPIAAAASGPAPPTAASGMAPIAVAKPPPAASPLAERWDALARRLAQQGLLAALPRELAWQASLASADDDATPPRWRLIVDRESLRTPALADRLGAAIEAAVGHRVALELQPGTPADTPARRDAAERDRLQALAEQTIRSDPVVVALLAQYKTARIVPGSIKPA